MSSPVAKRTRSQLELAQLREQVSKLQDAARLYEGACVGYKARIAYLEDDLVPELENTNAQLRADMEKKTSQNIQMEWAIHSLKDEKHSYMREFLNARDKLRRNDDKLEEQEIELDELRAEVACLRRAREAPGSAAGSAGGDTPSCPICFEPFDPENGRRTTAVMHDDDANACHVVCAGCAPELFQEGMCWCRKKIFGCGPIYM